MNSIIDERQIADIIKALQDLPEKMEKNILKSAVRSGAAAIRDAIKANAPVKSGLLKKSIKVKSIKGKKGEIKFRVKTGVLVGYVKAGTNEERHVNYAKQIEFGNSKMAAKPFIRPAFDEVEKRVLDAVVDKIKIRMDIVNNSGGGSRSWE